MKLSLLLFFYTYFVLSVINVYAISYYVKEDGNDKADGLSDENAWRTLAKVKSYDFKAGDDLYFKSGSVWKNELLIIGWSGTKENRVEIGSYFVDKGVIVTPGVTKNNKRPIFIGDYSESMIGQIGSVPKNKDDAMVQLHGSFITVKNLQIKNSSAHGIMSYESEFNVIENNDIYRTVGGLIQGRSGSNYLTVRNNTGSFCAWSINEGVSPYSEIPGCISVTGSKFVLIESNDIEKLYGYAYSVTQQSDYNVIRNNIMADGREAGIYVNNSSYVIVEKNMIIGGENILNGIEISLDEEAIESSVENIIRNNLLSGGQNCFSVTTKITKPNDHQFGLNVVGNSCVGANVAVVFLGKDDKFTDLKIINNLFWDIKDKSSACNIPISEKIRAEYNNWSYVADDDLSCLRSGDTIGNPQLMATTDFREFTEVNRPSVTDFNIGINSALVNQGIFLDEKLVNVNEYLKIENISNLCGINGQLLATDFLCAERGKPNLDIGALEYRPPTVSNIPRPPTGLNVRILR